jgi:hypothetical protein
MSLGKTNVGKGRRRRLRLRRAGHDCGRVPAHEVGTLPMTKVVSSAKTLPQSSVRVSYYGLRQSAWKNGECRECGHSPNKTVSMMTDVGERDLVRCSKCGLLMRPW